MATFKTKSIEVEAEQFIEGDVPPFKNRSACRRTSDGKWYVLGINGREFINDGDWIITEPDGIHFRAEKQGIFEDTHEVV